MNIRFINPTAHGVLDYCAAAGLIALPFILGLGRIEPVAPWISVAGGLTLIGYSLLTDYRFGLRPLLPISIHLRVDMLAATAFFVVPFLFGFEDLVAGYFWVMAAGVAVVVALSDEKAPAHERSDGPDVTSLGV